MPEGEEREKGTENIFQEIIAENFPHMGKEPLIQIQEAQRVPYKINPRRRTLRHIIIKLKKIKDKENNRAKRAKEVETAISAAESAQKKANKLLNDFLKDYGSFHATIKTPKEESYTDIDSILNNLMRKILE